MTDPEIREERIHEGIAIIRLCAPSRKNAFTGVMARALIAALRRAEDDTTVGAVIVTGGPHAFCAGAHRGLLDAVASGTDPQADLDIHAVYEVFETIRAMSAPTLAVVCGPAVGAGLNLALACDVRLVGENTYLRSMFVANQIHPAGGHLRMLHAIGGRALTVRLAVLDEPLDAPGAVAAGLAIGPYAPDQAEDAAIQLARAAAQQPKLVRLIHESAQRVINLPDDVAANLEAQAQSATLRQRRR